jgi:hypothetical protein
MKTFFALLFIFSNTCLGQTLNNSENNSLISGIERPLLEDYVIADKAKLNADSLKSDYYYSVSR